MKAIILSAGQGKRLLPLTSETPKAALQIGEFSLLEWQLTQISKTAVDEIVVVTGFGASHIDQIVQNYDLIKITTLFNPFYQNCDNLGTCWIARSEMSKPFLIINGDTLFEAEVLNKLLNQDSRLPITLTCDKKESYDSDDMKIIEENGTISQVGKTLPPNEVTGESIGLVKFDSVGAKLFSDQIDRMVRQNDGLGKWYLSAIDIIAKNGSVGSCFVDGLRWCEVDDANDMAIAEKTVATWSLK